MSVLLPFHYSSQEAMRRVHRSVLQIQLGARRRALQISRVLKTAELLLAHGQPLASPEPAGVSPSYCRGVPSLYCAYTKMSWN